MKTHKLQLDSIFEEKFHILAIYSDEPDYRLAFLLNKYLGIQLKKSTSIVEKKNKTEFCVFEYEDHSLYRNWYLIKNYSFVEKKVVKENDLFTQNLTFFHQKTTYIQELKKAHYLLKIEADENTEFYEEIIEKTQSIPQIYMVELVDLEGLKAKKKLIF